MREYFGDWSFFFLLEITLFFLLVGVPDSSSSFSTDFRITGHSGRAPGWCPSSLPGDFPRGLGKGAGVPISEIIRL